MSHFDSSHKRPHTIPSDIALTRFIKASFSTHTENITKIKNNTYLLVISFCIQIPFTVKYIWILLIASST